MIHGMKKCLGTNSLKSLLAMGLTLLTLTAAQANTYYVATNGSTANAGTQASPWPSVDYALSRVGRGHTILLRPGIYRGDIVVQANYAGTSGAPTIIRSEVKWKAMVVGAAFHGLSTAGGCDWVVFDGFEVLGARYDGIKLNGNNNVARNCWVHNNNNMGISSHGHNGTVIESNLIEYNGQHPSYHHGIYADGDNLLVRANVIRRNAASGIQLWPKLTNSRVINNVVAKNAQGIGIGCMLGGAPNLIANNTVVENGIALGFYGGNGEVVINNILTCKDNLGDPNATIYQMSQGWLNSDYNLCLPASRLQGSHGLSVDPGLVPVGFYWLNTGSPARNRGTAVSAITTDFWGRSLPGGTPSLGAYVYSQYLTTSPATANWPDGMSYSFAADSSAANFWAIPLN